MGAGRDVGGGKSMSVLRRVTGMRRAGSLAFALLMSVPAGTAAVKDGGTPPPAVASHQCVTGSGGRDCLARYSCTLPRSVMSAPPGAVTVGNELTSATIRIGTCVPSRNSGATSPIFRLFASMNARVAMVGIV